MIGRIIAWCAKNRLATLLLVGLATAWGVLSLRNTALDAVPDLSDVQVIVFSEWMGRAPDLIEDNITYPVVSSMLGSPRVTAVRGQSMFGMSFVNVIFEDGTDLYWARSRVLEKLSTISNKLPQGVAVHRDQIRKTAKTSVQERCLASPVRRHCWRDTRVHLPGTA